jgi:hypothetical protein
MKKGSVYYFNPTCELAVANGSFSYMPPLLLQEMERDLSILPFIFCTENDYVLTENNPSENFLNLLKDAGFNLPRFCSLNELESMPDGSFASVIPWGWSPAAHYKLRNLKVKCSQVFRESPVFDWKDEHKTLYERSASLDFLKRILNNNPPGWFIDPLLCGEIVRSYDEIESLLKKHSSIVIKAPASSSGRGIQIIRRPKLNASNRQWISGILKQQEYLIVEPFIDKLLDVSFQFELMTESEIKYHEFSVFETNSNGQYKGTFIHPEIGTLLPDEDESEVRTKIELTAKILKSALEKSDFAANYQGYLGIDALLFKDSDQLKMQPCIEVNCRMNMGILCLKLQKLIHPKTKGKFEICPIKINSLRIFNENNTEIEELIYRDEKIYSGFLALTAFNPNSKFGAYLSLDSPK